MDIKEKARNYVDGKALSAIRSAVEEAYAEGYKDGFKDGSFKVDVEPRGIIVEDVGYQDLGLPSEKKWSFLYPYNKEGAFRLERMYTYEEASKLNIPTKADFLELIKYCEMIPEKDSNNNIYAWLFRSKKTGKSISLCKSKRIENLKTIEHESFLFWLKDDNPEGNNRLCADGIGQEMLGKVYMNDRLPIMLVK